MPLTTKPTRHYARQHKQVYESFSKGKKLWMNLCMENSAYIQDFSNSDIVIKTMIYRTNRGMLQHEFNGGLVYKISKISPSK